MRDDFPFLTKHSDITYLDSACVALKPEPVMDAIMRYYEDFPACAGRSAHKLGDQVTREFEGARKKIGSFFGVKPKHCLMTRNTTEGINLVAKSASFTTIITTDKEHNSNLVPWLASKKKHVVVDTGNGFDFEGFEKALESKNALVAMHHTSNLDGTSLPVQKITKLAHNAGAKVLIDGAQSAPHTAINLKKLGCDYFACSGHKMLGPSGTGMLYVKDYDLLDPFLLGGDTVSDTWLNRYALQDPPHRFEAGLQNYAGVIGLGAAIEYLSKRLSKAEKITKALAKQLREGLQDKGTILGDETSHLVSIIPEKMPLHDWALLLNSKNIMVRSGAFCVHSWFNKHDIKGAVRFSPYLYNTKKI